MEFKDIVKIKREELGLSLQEIADYIGVSVSTIQRYEKGEIKNIRRDKIYNLSKILKVSPAYLMGWEDSAKSTLDTFSKASAQSAKKGISNKSYYDFYSIETSDDISKKEEYAIFVTYLNSLGYEVKLDLHKNIYISSEELKSTKLSFDEFVSLYNTASENIHLHVLRKTITLNAAHEKKGATTEQKERDNAEIEKLYREHMRRSDDNL